MCFGKYDEASRDSYHLIKPMYESECVSLKLINHKESNIFILKMIAGENWLNEKMLNEWNKCLDIIEKEDLPNSVLISTSDGKFYSNGLDLLDKTMPEATDFIFSKVYPFYARLLIFRYPTIALINGHAFAGGWMMSLCHDYRIMNNEKGFVCMNEVKIPIPLSLGFAKIVQTKQDKLTAVCLEAKRYTAVECLQNGWIDQACGKEFLMENCIKMAEKVSDVLDNEVYSRIKRAMYFDCYNVLKNPEEKAIPLFNSKL